MISSSPGGLPLPSAPRAFSRTLSFASPLLCTLPPSLPAPPHSCLQTHSRTAHFHWKLLDTMSSSSHQLMSLRLFMANVFGGSVSTHSPSFPPPLHQNYIVKVTGNFHVGKPNRLFSVTNLPGLSAASWLTTLPPETSSSLWIPYLYSSLGFSLLPGYSLVVAFAGSVLSV